MTSAEYRYQNDPVFKRLVDTIYHGVVEKQYTPTEVRDAAMLASLMYEERHLRPMYFRADQIDPSFKS